MEKPKAGIVVSVNVILSLLILVSSSYSAYIVRNLEERLQQQYTYIMALSEKLNLVNEKLVAHLGWHDGKKKREE